MQAFRLILGRYYAHINSVISTLRKHSIGVFQNRINVFYRYSIVFQADQTFTKFFVNFEVETVVRFDIAHGSNIRSTGYVNLV